MNKLLHLNVKNGMPFKELDISLDSPGLNLIYGVNNDDVSAKESRNATGKSSFFKVINAHLFTLATGYTKNDIIHDDEKTYRSELVWQPHNSIVHNSYQYRNDKELGGTGALIYKGGDRNNPDAKNVSFDHGQDTQADISTRLGLNSVEWDFLVNLIDVDNDITNPFFCPNKEAKLNLIQQLYGLDYSQVKAENKIRNKLLNEALNNTQVSFHTSIDLIEEQIKALPERASLIVQQNDFGVKLIPIRESINSLRQMQSDIKNQTDLILAYEKLKEQIVEIGDVNLEQAILDSNTNLQTIQEKLSYFAKRRGEIIVYFSKYKDFENLDLSQKAYIESGIVYDAIQPEIDKISEEILNIDKIKTSKGKYLGALSWLESGQVKYNSVLDIQTRIQEIEDSAKQLANEYISYTSQLQKLEAEKTTMDTAQGFVVKISAIEGGETDTSQKNLDDATKKLFDLQSQITKHQEFVNSFNDGTCPTCNQPWVHCSEDDHKASIAAIENLGAELGVCEKYKVAMEITLKALIERDRLVSNVLANLEPLGVTLDGLGQAIENNSIEQQNINEARNILGETLEASKQESNSCQPLASITEEDLILVRKQEDSLPELQERGDYLKTAKTTIDRATVAEQELAKVSVGMEPVTDQDTIEIIDTSVGEFQASQSEWQAYLRWAQSKLPIYNEYHSEKYSNMESLMASVNQSDVDAMNKNLDDQVVKEAECQQQLSDIENKLEQRESLEKKLEEIQKKTKEIIELQNWVKVRSVIDFLTGPKGLIVPRIEGIFEQINTLMNFYLSIMIQDGSQSKTNLTARYGMSAKGPELNVQRGKKEVTKQTLSKSEKARVKLASCLAFREFLPPSKYVNLLFLDEIDGSSCEINAGRLWECVKMHYEKNPETSIWCVSHSPAIQNSDIWNGKFMVTKENKCATMRRTL